MKLVPGKMHGKSDEKAFKMFRKKALNETSKNQNIEYEPQNIDRKH